jgi:hypothetical protein
VSSAVEITDAHVARVTFVAADEQWLTVALSDGRRLLLPLAWFPRLAHGSPSERNDWRLIGDGEGVHWPELDEDLSLAGFLAGRKSQESAGSIKKWLSARKLVSRQRKVG